MSDTRLGDIVIYRNRHGIDMPAIVTAVLPQDRVQLQPFPPVGAGPRILDHYLGVAAAEDPDDRDAWRPR